jgi:hypothetical protein
MVKYHYKIKGHEEVDILLAFLLYWEYAEYSNIATSSVFSSWQLAHRRAITAASRRKAIKVIEKICEGSLTFHFPLPTGGVYSRIIEE